MTDTLEQRYQNLQNEVNKFIDNPDRNTVYSAAQKTQLFTQVKLFKHELVRHHVNGTYAEGEAWLSSSISSLRENIATLAPLVNEVQHIRDDQYALQAREHMRHFDEYVKRYHQVNSALQKSASLSDQEKAKLAKGQIQLLSDMKNLEQAFVDFQAARERDQFTFVLVEVDALTHMINQAKNWPAVQAQQVGQRIPTPLVQELNENLQTRQQQSNFSSSVGESSGLVINGVQIPPPPKSFLENANTILAAAPSGNLDKFVIESEDNYSVSKISNTVNYASLTTLPEKQNHIRDLEGMLLAYVAGRSASEVGDQIEITGKDRDSCAILVALCVVHGFDSHCENEPPPFNDANLLPFINQRTTSNDYAVHKPLLDRVRAVEAPVFPVSDAQPAQATPVSTTTAGTDGYMSLPASAGQGINAPTVMGQPGIAPQSSTPYSNAVFVDTANPAEPEVASTDAYMSLPASAGQGVNASTVMGQPYGIVAQASSPYSNAVFVGTPNQAAPEATTSSNLDYLVLPSVPVVASNAADTVQPQPVILGTSYAVIPEANQRQPTQYQKMTASPPNEYTDVDIYPLVEPSNEYKEIVLQAEESMPPVVRGYQATPSIPVTGGPVTSTPTADMADFKKALEKFQNVGGDDENKNVNWVDDPETKNEIEETQVAPKPTQVGNAKDWVAVVNRNSAFVATQENVTESTSVSAQVQQMIEEAPKAKTSAKRGRVDVDEPKDPDLEIKSNNAPKNS